MEQSNNCCKLCHCLVTRKMGKIFFRVKSRILPAQSGCLREQVAIVELADSSERGRPWQGLPTDQILLRSNLFEQKNFRSWSFWSGQRVAFKGRSRNRDCNIWWRFRTNTFHGFSIGDITVVILCSIMQGSSAIASLEWEIHVTQEREIHWSDSQIDCANVFAVWKHLLHNLNWKFYTWKCVNARQNSVN